MKKRIIFNLILVFSISVLSHSQTVFQITQSGGINSMPSKVHETCLDLTVDEVFGDVSNYLPEALLNVTYADVTHKEAISIKEKESEMTAAGGQSFVCGNNVRFIYRGQQVTYGTIRRGGLCWMDRNLGASRVPTSSTDSRGYGDLFQWGRGDDGHQDRQSRTSSTLSNTNIPGHGSFITVARDPYDWRSPQNNNLWQGTNGINNPCPPGWRLPTEVEFHEELRSWDSNNSAGAYASTLKWPVGGGRSYSGALSNVGSGGLVWSSSASLPFVRTLYFYSGFAATSRYNRAHGMSVRCVRDL